MDVSFPVVMLLTRKIVNGMLRSEESRNFRNHVFSLCIFPDCRLYEMSRTGDIWILIILQRNTAFCRASGTIAIIPAKTITG